MLSHFIVGDPIQCAFTLQVVAETAFTNVVFVATPDVAARNGDFTLPTTYLSVQSDEARHISNGYATLLTVLQDDHNAPLIERDLQQAFWINHAFIDVFSAVVIEYFSRDRSDPESFLDKWDRWVRDDWHRAYIMKLGKLGLDIPPDMFERARERLVAGLHHRHAILAFAGWPLSFWRFDPLDERDFEWFESKYPGWYAQYGGFWEAFRQGADPRNGFLPLDFINMAPPFCWTCQGLCVNEADRVHRIVARPHAVLLLEGVPLAGRVQPRPLHRRSQLPGPLPRLGGVGGDPGPRVRALRRRDAHRPAPPARRAPLDAVGHPRPRPQADQPQHPRRARARPAHRGLVATLPRSRRRGAARASPAAIL